MSRGRQKLAIAVASADRRPTVKPEILTGNEKIRIFRNPPITNQFEISNRKFLRRLRLASSAAFLRSLPPAVSSPAAPLPLAPLRPLLYATGLA